MSARLRGRHWSFFLVMCLVGCEGTSPAGMRSDSEAPPAPSPAPKLDPEDWLRRAVAGGVPASELFDKTAGIAFVQYSEDASGENPRANDAGAVAVATRECTAEAILAHVRLGFEVAKVSGKIHCETTRCTFVGWHDETHGNADAQPPSEWISHRQHHRDPGGDHVPGLDRQSPPLPRREPPCPRWPKLRSEMRRVALALVVLGCSGCTRSAASTDLGPRASTAAATSTTSPTPSASAPKPPKSKQATGPAPAIHPAGARTVKSERGLVVTVEPQASRVGARILQAGGNAVDAAVAIAFALAVTHPSAGNIGGGGFMLVRPKNGPSVAIDFRETAPGALTRAKFDQMIAAGGEGVASVGVPGTVRGLWLAHEKLGHLAWKDLVAPAVELANKGHVVGRREANTFVWNARRLKKDPAAMAEFGDGKDFPKAGDKLRRPDFAHTLERIRDQGDKGFYEGATARAIVKRLAKGGLLVAADLEHYTAKTREPLSFSYRGFHLETMPPPSAGGVVVMEILGMLEELRVWKEPAGSAAELHLFLEASRRAQTDRRFSVVDPDSLSEANRSAALARYHDSRGMLDRFPIDRSHATPSEKVHPLYAEALRESEHTTHFSVVDADGMVVSTTTTLSAGFGSKIVVPGTGIVLNNAVASFSTAGGKSPRSGPPHHELDGPYARVQRSRRRCRARIARG